MYFCVNCFTSKEESVKDLVTRVLQGEIQDDFLVWFPKKETKEKRQGKYETTVKPLFPSYIFIYWDGEHEADFPFYKVRKIPGVVRFLGYDDGSHGLKGKDLTFAKWVHMHDGLIGQSKVVFKEGQKLHICEGPLRGLDGNVIKVDKHHKRIVLRFEFGGTVSDVNFSVEFLNASAKSESKHYNDI